VVCSDRQMVKQGRVYVGQVCDSRASVASMWDMCSTVRPSSDSRASD
jgi:hypothetical protein